MAVDFRENDQKTRKTRKCLPLKYIRIFAGRNFRVIKKWAHKKFEIITQLCNSALWKNIKTDLK